MAMEREYILIILWIHMDHMYRCGQIWIDIGSSFWVEEPTWWRCFESCHSWAVLQQEKAKAAWPQVNASDSSKSSKPTSEATANLRRLKRSSGWSGNHAMSQDPCYTMRWLHHTHCVILKSWKPSWNILKQIASTHSTQILTIGRSSMFLG